MYIYVCVCACVYVYTYEEGDDVVLGGDLLETVSVCMCVYVYIYMHVCLYIHIWIIYMYTYMHTCVRTHINVYEYTCVCMYRRICTYMQTSMVLRGGIYVYI